MRVAILYDAGSDEWSPQDVAAAVAYLASPAARVVTGHVLDLNGGMAM